MTSLYRFYSETGLLLYVGITGHLPQRLSQHAAQKPWWTEVHSVKVEHFFERYNARAAELVAIQTEYPAYNIADTCQDSELHWHERVDLGWDRLCHYEPVMPLVLDFARIVGECFGGEGWCAPGWWNAGFKDLVAACVGEHRVSPEGDEWLRTSNAQEVAESIIYWRTLPDCQHPDTECSVVTRESFTYNLRHLGRPKLREWYSTYTGELVP